MKAKVSSHLCFARGTLPELKQSEMAATFAGLGDSQVKPSGESRLAVASTGPGGH